LPFHSPRLGSDEPEYGTSFGSAGESLETMIEALLREWSSAEASSGPDTRLVVFQVDGEAERFMRERGLTEAFARVRDLVRENFPGLRHARVLVRQDPEIEDYTRIVIEVAVEASTEEMLEWEDAFTDALLQTLPPEQALQFVLFPIYVG